MENIHKTAGTFLVRYNQEIDNREVNLIYYNWTLKLFGRSSSKGHVENDETNEQAAIRETKEETGYQDFSIIGDLGCNEFQYSDNDGNIHYKQTFWYCAKLNSDLREALILIDDENRSREKDGRFSLDEATELLRFDDEKSLIPKIKLMLESANS